MELVLFMLFLHHWTKSFDGVVFRPHSKTIFHSIKYSLPQAFKDFKKPWFNLIQIHAQFGRYYRLRIPRFGRDLVYHPTNCDVYFVGDGSEVHRLNLEQGRFLNPLQTDALSGLNVCALNPEHLLFMSGSVDGKIEAWDPRCRERVGVLDCALGALEEDAGDQVVIDHLLEPLPWSKANQILRI